MRPALLLVDLQNDFLSAAGLEPPAAAVVAGARRLLAGAREAAIPVVHVVTTVDAAADDRMPHWRTLGRWRCVRGTPGHAAPAVLSPAAGEATVSKRFFSAFSSPDLERVLGAAGADTLVVAGVHLHGCVRGTVLDAYERGFRVWVAEDAVGTDDPLHGAITRRYLEGRAARLRAGRTSPRARRSRASSDPEGGEDVAAAAEASAAARRASGAWIAARTPSARGPSRRSRRGSSRRPCPSRAGSPPTSASP